MKQARFSSTIRAVSRQELGMLHTCGLVESTASATAESKDRESGGVKSPAPWLSTRISVVAHEGLLKLWMTNGVAMLVSNLPMFSLTPSKLSTTAARVSRSPPNTVRHMSLMSITLSST